MLPEVVIWGKTLVLGEDLALSLPVLSEQKRTAWDPVYRKF